MNVIRTLTRTCAAASARRAANVTFPAYTTIFARRLAVPPKRSDADPAAAPSNRATFSRPRMPSSVVSRRSAEVPPAASAPPPPSSSLAAELRSSSVADLKRQAAARGINTSGFFEKEDYVRALLQPPPSPRSPPASSFAPAAVAPVSTMEPQRPFANMPVDNPDTQIQVNENPSSEVVNRGLSTLLGQPYIMIKRRLEMFNIMIGFEQNNQYTIYGATGEVVGYIVEDNQGIKGTLWRNVAHTHRPFTARIMDPQGNIILKVSRGFFFFTSSLSVTHHDGDFIGEIEQEFTVLRRKYSLFARPSSGADKQQFGLVNAPTLSLNFNVEDDDYNVIAAIDRDFSSFGDAIASMFIDKSSYVVHFTTRDNELYNGRLSYMNTPEGAAGFFSTDKTPEERLREGPKALSGSQQGTAASSNSSLTASSSRSQLATGSAPGHTGAPMTLRQKAVVLGAAISIDFDYFSRHSSSSNTGVLGGMGGLFGGFGGDGGDGGGYSDGGHSEPPDSSSASNQPGDSESSGYRGGSDPSPSHGKFGEELDTDNSEIMNDKWDNPFSDGD